ncbi:hypothetical protein SOPP22_15340 [Shewanella sp. OPT22]|nr:hypothetical protein SOPP22_15340 [Shewanella sp. OPT22]
MNRLESIVSHPMAIKLKESISKTPISTGRSAYGETLLFLADLKTAEWLSDGHNYVAITRIKGYLGEHFDRFFDERKTSAGDTTISWKSVDVANSELFQQFTIHHKLISKQEFAFADEWYKFIRCHISNRKKKKCDALLYEELMKKWMSLHTSEATFPQSSQTCAIATPQIEAPRGLQYFDYMTEFTNVGSAPIPVWKLYIEMSLNFIQKNKLSTTSIPLSPEIVKEQLEKHYSVLVSNESSVNNFLSAYIDAKRLLLEHASNLDKSCAGSNLVTIRDYSKNAVDFRILFPVFGRKTSEVAESLVRKRSISIQDITGFDREELQLLGVLC